MLANETGGKDGWELQGKVFSISVDTQEETTPCCPWSVCFSGDACRCWPAFCNHEGSQSGGKARHRKTEAREPRKSRAEVPTPQALYLSSVMLRFLLVEAQWLTTV